MKTGHADDALKALLLLRSEMAQRDARLGAALSQQIEALQQQAGHFRHDVNAIIRGAGVQIATEAKAAVSPVAREYDRAVSATSARLHRASRTVWAWFGVAAALLVFVDVMKELPVTLVLRPFNSDTLAVVAYQLARDERLGEAALPSLALVLVGLIPVVLLSRTLRQDRA